MGWTVMRPLFTLWALRLYDIFSRFKNLSTMKSLNKNKSIWSLTKSLNLIPIESMCEVRVFYFSINLKSSRLNFWGETFLTRDTEKMSREKEVRWASQACVISERIELKWWAIEIWRPFPWRLAIEWQLKFGGHFREGWQLNGNWNLAAISVKVGTAKCKGFHKHPNNGPIMPERNENWVRLRSYLVKARTTRITDRKVSATLSAYIYNS